MPALFKLIDSAVLFEGEEPLLRLAETLAGRGDLSGVPNLIWRDGAAVRGEWREDGGACSCQLAF